MNLDLKDIEALETRFRANMINALGGFKSLVLIGTKSREGNENLALFSSLFHVGAHPALCGIVLRPNEEKQNTLGNIMSAGQFTVNHILPSFYRQAHQCSAKYEEGVSEFMMTGLTPEYEEGIMAPFVEESKVKFACSLAQKLEIALNGTTIIIGSIIRIIAPEEILGSDGFLDLERAETITCSGLDSYHVTRKIARLSYAKTDKTVQEI